ncbi:hypothetical protein AYL99_09572 [Fonsecaea erecta]|uniref:Uncharacterized protein n=1 Tax=Fonsecaea erecta TaxID=1367422 RepID=A0A178ZB22_9EURO|nr:hypothetical protein AYL99_09572 [Fonsecaea erecta]OAP56393.1 hypothetical protein AYL99_09572 [Fonsecaea erecta]
MDGLSDAASLIAVIKLSCEVIGFVGTASGATKERKRVREEVQACQTILQQLKDEADESEEGQTWTKIINALEELHAPLGRLSIALNLLKTRLEPRSGQRILTSLKWPFQEKEVARIIDAIEREKALLGLALINDYRRLIQDLQKSSRENTRHVLELIDVVRSSSQGTEGQLAELRDGLARIEVLQADVNDGLGRLTGRDDRREASEEHKAVLDWLTTVDYASQQSDFISRRQPGTGQWLLDSTEFKTWVETDRQILFCPGIPGAGKTILTSIVVEYLHDKFRGAHTHNTDHHSGGNIGIAYLYCNFRRQYEQEASDLLASLLKQLSQARSSLTESVKQLYSQHRHKRTRPSFDEISRALQSIASTFLRVFIIVDAIDECQTTNGSQTKVLTEVFNIHASSGANIFVTSRFIPDITRKFEAATSLEIRASEEDVRRYVDGHIYRLPGFVSGNHDLQEEIKTGIVRSVGGMYLLAQLHLDSLVGKRSPKAIRAALANLSTGLKAQVYDLAYQNAMERIEGQVADQAQLAKQVLSWVTCTKRPLTTLELQHALAVEVGEAELDEENLPQIEDMVSVCAGLVTLDRESGIIRLVHHTAQEYFERTQKHWFPDAEAEITTCCVTYLSFDAFTSGHCASDEAFEGRLRLYPFYRYAAHYWGIHARQVSTCSTLLIDFLREISNVEAAAQGLFAVRDSWEPQYSQRVPKQPLGLHLAAHFGIEEATGILLQHCQSVEATDASGRKALSYAATGGHEPTVQLLLDRGADIEATDDNGQTPLWYAARAGHEAVVRLLLEKGANVEIQDRHGITPLLLAAGRGHEGVVRVLLEKGATVEIKNNPGTTPLMLAADQGHTTIVHFLLDNGADIEFRDAVGMTPLSWAAEGGHEDTVRLLLDKGADLEARDLHRKVPLWYAARGRHEAVMRLLLERGADAEPRDHPGAIPMWYLWQIRDRVIEKLWREHGHT